MQNTNNQVLLYRARLLLEEGEHDAALQIVNEVVCEDEKQRQEVSYLLGWGYIQQKQWDAAIGALKPLLEQQVHGIESGEPEALAERERISLYLLRLGVAAVNLSYYEDASLHFSLCLKILHDRRVHLPSVRIKARYSLGMTCLMRGLYTAAVQHYEEALRLCRYYDNEEEIPHVFHGLCDAYRFTGDFLKAYLSGSEALRYYQQRNDQSQVARMHNKLGRIRFLLNDFHDASEHYTESLATATSCQNYTMIMLNCAALADLRVAEGKLDAARRYCQLALDNMGRSDDVHMRGSTYYTVGKVAYEEARQARNEEARLRLLEEAVNWFGRAGDCLEKTQAYPDIAELYGAWAQALEDLGRVEEAIERWRAGYEMLSHSAVVP